MLLNPIISLLPSLSKQFLSYNDIKLPSTILLKPPLFNYISFCKFLETRFIDEIIQWARVDKKQYGRSNLLEQEIYKLFVGQCKNIKELLWDNSQPLPSWWRSRRGWRQTAPARSCLPFLSLNYSLELVFRSG